MRNALQSVLLLLACVPHFTFATDSWESIGTSAQAMARGGADVAVGDSALSQIDNPATLTLSPRDARRFDFAGQILFPKVTWSNPIDSATSKDPRPAGNAALTVPVNKKLTLGLAFYSKAGTYTDYKIRPYSGRSQKHTSTATSATARSSSTPDTNLPKNFHSAPACGSKSSPGDSILSSPSPRSISIASGPPAAGPNSDSITRQRKNSRSAPDTCRLPG